MSDDSSVDGGGPAATSGCDMEEPEDGKFSDDLTSSSDGESGSSDEEDSGVDDSNGGEESSEDDASDDDDEWETDESDTEDETEDEAANTSMEASTSREAKTRSTNKAPEKDAPVTPAPRQMVTDSSDDADGEDTENCAICLCRFRNQDVGTPESCDHNFCLECIREWSKNVNTCPVDRQVYRLILARHSLEGTVYKQIPIENRELEVDMGEEDESTYCEVCGRCDREDRLLLCDGCDLGYHCECLDSPLRRIPIGEWFCPGCQAVDLANLGVVEEEDDEDVLSLTPRRRHRPQRRQIARTLVAERVRAAIAQTRATRGRRIIVSDDSESEAEPAEVQPSTSSTIRASTRRTTTSKKTGQKKRRKTKKRKTTTKNRKTTKKKKTTTKKKKTTSTRKKTTKPRKSKRKRRKTKRRKLARTLRRTPSSIKERLAGKLGLKAPAAGRSIPTIKQGTDPRFKWTQHDNSSLPLTIMGGRDDLEPVCDFGYDDRDERLEVALAKRAAQARRAHQGISKASFRSHRPISGSAHKHRKLETVIPKPKPVSTATFDLLGGIMEGQNFLLMKGDDITIKRDGSLHANKAVPESTSPATEKDSLQCSSKKDILFPCNGLRPAATYTQVYTCTKGIPSDNDSGTRSGTSSPSASPRSDSSSSNTNQQGDDPSTAAESGGQDEMGDNRESESEEGAIYSTEEDDEDAGYVPPTMACEDEQDDQGDLVIDEEKKTESGDEVPCGDLEKVESHDVEEGEDRGGNDREMGEEDELSENIRNVDISEDVRNIQLPSEPAGKGGSSDEWELESDSDNTEAQVAHTDAAEPENMDQDAPLADMYDPEEPLTTSENSNDAATQEGEKADEEDSDAAEEVGGEEAASPEQVEDDEPPSPVDSDCEHVDEKDERNNEQEENEVEEEEEGAENEEQGNEEQESDEEGEEGVEDEGEVEGEEEEGEEVDEEGDEGEEGENVDDESVATSGTPAQDEREEPGTPAQDERVDEVEGEEEEEDPGTPAQDEKDEGDVEEVAASEGEEREEVVVSEGEEREEGEQYDDDEEEAPTSMPEPPVSSKHKHSSESSSSRHRSVLDRLGPMPDGTEYVHHKDRRDKDRERRRDRDREKERERRSRKEEVRIEEWEPEEDEEEDEVQVYEVIDEYYSHSSHNHSSSRSKDRHKDKHRDKDNERDREKEKEKEKRHDRRDRDHDRDRHRDRDRDKDREKEKDRDKSRDKYRDRKREKDKERRREKDRHNDRDRDRHKDRESSTERSSRRKRRKRSRSRSKERSRRSRHSRSRSRNRSGRRSHERSRSRKRERREKSRSRDRKRSKRHSRSTSMSRSRKDRRARDLYHEETNHHDHINHHSKEHGGHEEHGSDKPGLHDYRGSVKLFSQTLKEASEGESSRHYKLKRSFHQAELVDMTAKKPVSLYENEEFSEEEEGALVEEPSSKKVRKSGEGQRGWKPLALVEEEDYDSPTGHSPVHNSHKETLVIKVTEPTRTAEIRKDDHSSSRKDDYSRREDSRKDEYSNKDDYVSRKDDYSSKKDSSSRKDDLSVSRKDDYSTSRKDDYSSRKDDYSSRKDDNSSRKGDYSSRTDDASSRKDEHSSKKDSYSSRKSDYSRQDYARDADSDNESDDDDIEEEEGHYSSRKDGYTSSRRDDYSSSRRESRHDRDEYTRKDDYARKERSSKRKARSPDTESSSSSSSSSSSTSSSSESEVDDPDDVIIVAPDEPMVIIIDGDETYDPFEPTGDTSPVADETNIPLPPEKPSPRQKQKSQPEPVTPAKQVEPTEKPPEKASPEKATPEKQATPKVSFSISQKNEPKKLARPALMEEDETRPRRSLPAVNILQTNLSVVLGLGPPRPPIPPTRPPGPAPLMDIITPLTRPLVPPGPPPGAPPAFARMPPLVLAGTTSAMPLFEDLPAPSTQNGAATIGMRPPPLPIRQLIDGPPPARRDGPPQGGLPPHLNGIRHPSPGPQRFDGPPPIITGPPPRITGPPPRITGPPPRIDGPPPRLDGPPPRIDGPPPRIDGPPPKYDGPPPKFDGLPPKFDGPPPKFDGPPPNFDGPLPRLDGPPPQLITGPPPSLGRLDGPPPHGLPPTSHLDGPPPHGPPPTRPPPTSHIDGPPPRLLDGPPPSLKGLPPSVMPPHRSLSATCVLETLPVAVKRADALPLPPILDSPSPSKHLDAQPPICVTAGPKTPQRMAISPSNSPHSPLLDGSPLTPVGDLEDMDIDSPPSPTSSPDICPTKDTVVTPTLKLTPAKPQPVFRRLSPVARQKNDSPGPPRRLKTPSPRAQDIFDIPKRKRDEKKTPPAKTLAKPAAQPSQTIPSKALQEMAQISQLLNAQAKLAEMLHKPGATRANTTPPAALIPAKTNNKVTPAPVPAQDVLKVPVHTNANSKVIPPSVSPLRTKTLAEIAVEMDDAASPCSDEDFGISFSPPPEKLDVRKDFEKRRDKSRSSQKENKQDDPLASAAELDKHQKVQLLKKMNRQERVVEEVKLAIKPFYSKGTINKEEYKEIMRRAVPKICHSRSGDINPVKIRGLVEAYAKKMSNARKLGIKPNAAIDGKPLNNSVKQVK